MFTSLGEDITKDMVKLIDLQELLYDAGARNFLFVNVPPTNRAPFSMCPSLTSPLI